MSSPTPATNTPSLQGKWLLDFKGSVRSAGENQVNLLGFINVDQYGAILTVDPATAMLGVLQQKFLSQVAVLSGPDELNQNVSDDGEWINELFNQPVTGRLIQNPDGTVTMNIGDSMPHTNDGSLGSNIIFRLWWNKNQGTLKGYGKAMILPGHNGEFIFEGTLTPTL